MTDHPKAVGGTGGGDDSLRSALGALWENADVAKARPGGEPRPFLTFDIIAADGTRQPFVQTQSGEDLSPPATMSKMGIILLVERMGLKMTEDSAEQVNASLTLDQTVQDSKAKKLDKKMRHFFHLVDKMKKKMKLLKSVKIGVEIAGAVASVASLGALTGGFALALGLVACGINVAMAGMDMSGAMDKWAEKDPKGAQAFQISMMVLQIALTGGAAFAARAAQKTAEEAVVVGTETTAQAGEEAAGEAIEEASSVATAKAASVEGRAQDLSTVAGKDDAVAAKAEGKLMSKLLEGEEAEEADCVLGDTEEGLEGTTTGKYDKDLMAERVTKLCKALGRAAGGVEIVGAGASTYLQIENARLTKKMWNRQADMTELKSDIKVNQDMIEIWLSNYESISKEFSRTVEWASTMRTNVSAAHISASEASAAV